MTRRAKIAATLGPACEKPRILTALVEAGAEVVRINLSHARAEDLPRWVRRVRRVGRRLERPVTVLADLQGPRFRVGRLPGGETTLEPDDEVSLVHGQARASRGEIPVSSAALTRGLRRGDRVLLDDGALELRVLDKRGERTRCRVVSGGVLRERKGINLPGGKLSVPALTAKDRRDLRVAVDAGVDWLAMSFVRRGSDVADVKRRIRRAGASIPVMAKIERPEALDDLDSILGEADGVMVARGDLGVELPPERVPMVQKHVIEAAAQAGRPVMTATQMLDSMRHSPRPTRAETSDVANAVLDGSGCLLLTAETAAGDYPVAAVSMMARIIEAAESSGRVRVPVAPQGPLSVSEAACLAACGAATDVDARWVVAFTQSGATATSVARFRPVVPILAFTPVESVRRRLGPVWGVRSRHVSALRSTDALMEALDRRLLAEGLAKRGDRVVVLSGSPGRPGTTNLVKVHRVGV